jgi:hypothetical protein
MTYVVSTPDVVARAHTQVQVEAVVKHTFFRLLHFISKFFGACQLTQTQCVGGPK